MNAKKRKIQDRLIFFLDKNLYNSYIINYSRFHKKIVQFEKQT